MLQEAPMSFYPDLEPECKRQAAAAVELEIDARTRALGGGFTVRRLLPSAARRMVGPFIFVDHMGPVQLAAGSGLDVRPHPHINLATVTFLFDGEILHRDSLGSEQPIRPGAVNWMHAGRGIAHSERSPSEARKTGPFVHGMQLWVALPTAHEEDEPSFQHHAADAIPLVETTGARLRVIAGSAYGAVSPVRVVSPLFYVEARLERGARLALPDEHRGRAAYVVEGAVAAGDKTHGPGAMLVFREGVPAEVEAREESRVMLLGGAPLDGERHIWWNFVSSSPERIERAKDDWRNGRFGRVPGDDVEFIPLPDA
jgi:redox-sensitive bicupin YhaK (pirin superfamily)